MTVESDQQQDGTIPHAGDRSSASDAAGERELRAKYLDWSSAQLADHFLSLSPDEIFELAERAERDHGVGGRSLSASGGDDPFASYRLMVQRVTEVLTQQLDLPSFEEWLELYRRNPAAVEEQLLGLWRDNAEGGAD
jgi:hypothetical protein